MHACAIPQRRSAFTIMEVLVAALLIALAIGSIMTMNVKAFHVLRASRMAAAGSQVLQQRIEVIRDRTWAEVSNSSAIVSLLSQPADSEVELADPEFIETMKVTVPQPGPSGLAETARSFTVQRIHGRATASQVDDFSREPTLFFEGTVTWHDHSGAHVRNLRTAVCRIGLTRSGVAGSVLGRVGAAGP
jgi:Tfp pilus assembly protein PilV